MKKKPNILVIMTDEHDPAVTGCYGDKIVHTPNIDNLARHGITFDACYTNSPLCVPARLSFTAGQYISRVGAWNNRCMLPQAEILSLPHILNDAGYETVLCGKMHYARNRRYGFQTDLLPSHNNSIKGFTARRRQPNDEIPDLKSWYDRSNNFKIANKSPILKKDRQRTASAIDFLSNRKQTEKPFFMLLGFIAPHFPLTAPRELYEKYRDKVPMPNIPKGLLEKLPHNYKHLRRGFGVENTKPEFVKFGRELYWALTEWMDQNVGKILDTLKDSEVADNTIVIFTTDHGENKGDHGLWWKNNVYDHAARVPLIVSWPKRWDDGSRRTKVCSLVDLVQTIIDISGEKIPEHWDGDSLCAYLDSSNAPWKDFAVCEYYGHNIFSGITMYRQGDWKYVYHNPLGDYPAETELYNMREDPEELKNLASNPEYPNKIEKMHELLTAELGMDPKNVESLYYLDYSKKKINRIAWYDKLLHKFKNRKLKKKLAERIVPNS
jgi:choline-sulfatase